MLRGGLTLLLPEHQLPLLAIHFDRQIVRMEAAPEGGEVCRGEVVHEAEGGGGQVGAVLLEGEPAAGESLRGAAGGIGTGEDVQDGVAGVGQEFDEEGRQL